jgi:hypothetical protein
MDDTWIFHLEHLLVVVAGVVGGVVTAIANYFWIHSDTNMTREQMWAHIWGIFAFFVMGCCLFGVGTYLVLRFSGVAF